MSGVFTSSVRFIPARAGNTLIDPERPGSGPVHPRSRGEHALMCLGFFVHNGSSPLARGTLPDRGLLGDDDRFIPARAGNTWRAGASTSWSPVHPRSRGEHATASRKPSGPIGSSPLARGTHRRRARGGVRVRFIPARAGNTSRTPSPSSTATVHPRSRGEHPGSPGPSMPWCGSSPLARGTPHRKR